MKKSVHVLTVFVYVLSFLLANAGSTLAENSGAATKISHKPLKYFVPGHRITVNAEVTDQTGVTVVRVYFRAPEQADYVFVSMNPAADGTYQGILPAPAKETQNITYLFLAVNGKNQVVKTQTFTVNREDKEKVPAWQQAASEGNIQVSTELAQAPESISGFTDSIAMDVVESSARFGLVVGGIYLLAQKDDLDNNKDLAGKADSATAGASESSASAGTVETATTSLLNDRLSGAAASSVSGGTITASTGWSTAAIVGIGAGVAAGVAGIAVAAGSSSGGGDDDNDSGGVIIDVTSRDVEICVIDSNAVLDEGFDLYLNDSYIGPVKNIPGGSVCYNVTLNSGANTIFMKYISYSPYDTYLTINVNPGGWTKNFGGSQQDYTWVITAP